MSVNDEESVNLENAELHKYALTCFLAAKANMSRLEKEEFVNVTTFLSLFFIFHVPKKYSRIKITPLVSTEVESFLRLH